MKRLRVLQILNFWRLIPAYMCICMAPVEVKHVVIEELYHWKKCDKRKEIESIIGKLKYSELSINEIPFEYQQNMDIIREERKLNLRRSGRRGFDVIRQVFFVEEWENTGDNGDELHQDEKLFGN